MVDYRSMKCIVSAGVLFTLLFSIASAQTDQEIYFKYCVATPDTECFDPISGVIDTVGRDVGALGGGYRICLPIAVNTSIPPVQVVIALDRSGSMDNNDPDNMRCVAAHTFVDSLLARAPESYVGSVVFSDGYDEELSLPPVQLSDPDAFTSLWNSLENASDDPQLRKKLGIKATTQGEAFTASLDMLLELRERVPGMEQHIIMITDDGWFEEDDIMPEGVLQAYTPRFPNNAFPQIHTVMLSDDGNPGERGLANLQMIADRTGGLYIENATPATIVANLSEILESIKITVPSTLESMSVTNLTNGEVRNHTGIEVVPGGDDTTIVQFYATIDNLPLEFGYNTIVVQRSESRPGTDQPVTTTDTAAIFRTDAWTTTVDPKEYEIYCTDDTTAVSITVSPPTQFINEPFDVQSTILLKEKFILDTVDVRVFTQFPDTDAGTVAVFHLDTNLNNSASGTQGNGSSVVYTDTDMLFGSGALSSGSFSTAIGNLTGDFSFEAWIHPSDVTTATELFSAGGFIFGIDNDRNCYASDNGALLLLSQSSLSVTTWSHVAISRVSGEIIITINGLSVTDFAEYAGTLSGTATITCPVNAVMDEIRISSTSRMNPEKFSAASRLDMPSVQNIIWIHRGTNLTQDVLTLAPGDWADGSIAFQFTSPVPGGLVVNFQHKGTTVATVWSKNGNPVVAVEREGGPYITRAMITPGPMNSSEDKIRVFFSKRVQCDSLKKSGDLTESFRIFGFGNDPNTLPVEKNQVFAGGRYENETCTSEGITEVTLYVKKEAAAGIVALQDSIKLVGSVVDMSGNYPDSTRLGYIESVNTVSINVTPPMRITNTPFDVAAQLVIRNTAPVENIDVRVFTGFPDYDTGTVEVFHLDTNLNSSASDNSGISSGVNYTSDKMLFGKGAISSGSFSTAIGNLTGDFSFEAWIRPSRTTPATEIFSTGNFTFGINNELKLYASSGDSPVVVSSIPLDSTWTHVAVSRVSGRVILLINGLSVSGFAELDVSLSGAAIITCPENALLDEVRISRTHRLIENTPASTVRFAVPTIPNITWKYNGVVQTQEVLTISASDWSTGNVAFTFSSPVGGELIVNFQDNGASPSTIWSRNGNPVYCATDLDGPYITNAVLIPGPIDSLEDTLKVFFSEPVICDSLKKNRDLTQTFKVYEFIVDPTTGATTPHVKDLVFVGGRFNSDDCLNERITDVTLLVRTRYQGGIVPLQDSIKLFGSVVDTIGNYPDTTKFGSIVFGPGAGIKIRALSTEPDAEPMRVPDGIKVKWSITEDFGKVVVIQTRAPLVSFTTVTIDGKPVENYSYQTHIYDAVGNLVALDPALRKTPESDRMYFLVWNGTNRSNRKVASGVYLLRTSVKYQNDLNRFVPLQTKFSIKWERN